jgi:hypothetical protein
MWHGEAIHRMEKLPKMDKFLSGKKPKNGEAEIKARFLSYQKKRDLNVDSSATNGGAGG